MYRVQGDDDYPQPNHNLANLAGALWYLHNEIVWHKEGRYGTYFSSPVTRILKLRVQMRATQPLLDLGMNFGVMNTFDSGECTGPWSCDNLRKGGYAVGCETWEAGAESNFPHQQWNHMIHYPGAVWYSLPGECPSQPYTNKTEHCIQSYPGGLCPPGVTPTGAWDCTYRYFQVGEITINELEGIPDYEEFIRQGGREYDPKTDKGVHTSFWDRLQDAGTCQWRIDQANQKFATRYPGHQVLPEPACDFNRHKFYADRAT